MPRVACEATWLWDHLCNPKESKQVQRVGKVKFRSVSDFFATRSCKLLEVHRLLCMMAIGLAKLPLPLLTLFGRPGAINERMRFEVQGLSCLDEAVEGVARGAGKLQGGGGGEEEQGVANQAFGR